VNGDLDDVLSAAAKLGQDGGMPTRLTPELPPRVAAAHKAVSSTARVLVLRYLMAHPESTRTEIAEGSEQPRGSAWFALRELEELGYAVHTGTGRSYRYSIDSEKLRRDLLEFVEWTLGGSE